MSQRSFDRDARRRQDAERRRTTLRRRRAGLAAGLAGAAALAAPAVANADSFQVTSVGDTPEAGKTTLREAIASAEGTSQDSTITFASTVRGTIELSSGEIAYDTGKGGALDIQGPGADALSVEGGSMGLPFRVFAFEGFSSVAVSGLTLTRGGAIDTNVDSDPVNSTGGAILSVDTDLTVTNASIVENFAKFGGGGIAQVGGSLTVENSHVDSNEVKYSSNDDGRSGGGILAIEAPLSVAQSTVDNNAAENGAGGGIAAYNSSGAVPARQSPLARVARQVRGGSSANAEITDSSVSGNRSGNGGGGKFLLEDYDVSITRSTFADNTATGTIVSGRGPIMIPAPRQTKGDPGPGPIPVPTPTPDSRPGNGGGAFVVSRTSDIDESTFSGNRALRPEDPEPTENPDTENPDTENPDTENPDTELPDIASKSTKGDDPTVEDGPVEGLGGGLFVFGPDGSVSNSTVANNQAGAGGGILTAGEPTGEPETGEQFARQARSALRTVRGDLGEDAELHTVVDNSTVSGNEALAGGGVFTFTGGFDASSTIIAGNTAEEAPDVGVDDGSLNAQYSLIQVPGEALTSAQTNITGQAAQLGELTNNGGPTNTLLPATSSPAIDQGTGNELDDDQRGLSRTQDLGPANAADGTDIGAVEIQAPPVVPGTTPGGTAPSATRPVTPSSIPVRCSRRALSLTDARVKNGKVVLKGLVGSRYYGKKVTIQTDPEGAKASGYSKTASVTAAKTDGTFTVSVPKPGRENYPTVRYRAKIGKATSPALKLPQSLTLKSVKSAKGTITVTGRVRQAVLGKRNKVTIRRLACGRYRTMGRVKPNADGTYSLTFKATNLRGVALYRAESVVQVRPNAKKYVKQYGRAIAIKTTGQTG